MIRIFSIPLILVFLLSLSYSSAQAQRAKGDKVTYTYYRLPLIKTPEGNRTYTVETDIPYADTYNEAMANYERDEAQAQQEYEEDRKQADEDFKAAMEAYNCRGAGAKILTGMLVDGSGKPEKREVEKRYVQKPKVRNDIPTESEIANAIKWDGFEQTDGAHYTLNVNMPEYTLIMKDEVSGEKWYRSVNINVPINYTVKDAGDQVVLRGSVQYTVSNGNAGIASRTTPTFKTDKMEKAVFDEFVNGTGYETWLDAKKAEARSFGLAILSEDINSQLGYGWVERTSPIYSAKGNKFDYSALDQAALMATQGLQELSINEELAKDKLNKAMTTWNSELEQADLDDKKARINNKVAAGLYINLAIKKLLEHLNNSI